MRDIYLAADRAEAEALIDKTIAACADDDVGFAFGRPFGPAVGVVADQFLLR